MWKIKHYLRHENKVNENKFYIIRHVTGLSGRMIPTTSFVMFVINIIWNIQQYFVTGYHYPVLLMANDMISCMCMLVVQIMWFEKYASTQLKGVLLVEYFSYDIIVMYIYSIIGLNLKLPTFHIGKSLYQVSILRSPSWWAKDKNLGSVNLLADFGMYQATSLSLIIIACQV